MSEFRPSYRTTQAESGRVVKTKNVVFMAVNNFALDFILWFVMVCPEMVVQKAGSQSFQNVKFIQFHESMFETICRLTQVELD